MVVVSIIDSIVNGGVMGGGVGVMDCSLLMVVVVCDGRKLCVAVM